jgi:antitoxin (DNA-binding transcriptional repressor) of toxin-antitoxin stability system
MRISVAEAEGRLRELVERAQHGEEVVLTQDGLSPVRLEVVQPVLKTATKAYDAIAEMAKLASLFDERDAPGPEEKRKIFKEIRDRVRNRRLPAEPDAARSQDFLYDEFGLPK